MRLMNKTLAKAVMTRSKLRNKYLKLPTDINNAAYKKHWNYCVKLFKMEKKKYYNNLDNTSITDNNIFWKTVKPCFSDNRIGQQKIVVVENDEIISNDDTLADTFNIFFSNIMDNLGITGYPTEDDITGSDDQQISIIINKYKDHPSIININVNIKINEHFSIAKMNKEDVVTILKLMNINKPTTKNARGKWSSMP